MQPLWYFIAFVIVVALIGATAWLVRRFAGGSIGGGATRGRMPRLAVIDAAAVDGRRRLVLVRRDNVEHLLIIGGPTDVVVETNIVRSGASRDQMPARSPAGTELPARVSPLPDASAWGPDDDASRNETFDSPEPPVVPQRPPPRVPHPEDHRRPAVAERRGGSEFGSFVPEPMTRPEPLRSEPSIRPGGALRSDPRPSSPSRTEPVIPRSPRPAEAPSRGPAALTRSTPRPPEPPMSAADQNLAEMAQRLEAALRRPGTTEPKAPTVSHADRIGAPPVAPEQPPASRPSSETDTAASPASSHQPDIKTGFENLEDEMASLLGRPKTPS